MNETLKLTMDEREKITQAIALFADQLRQWARGRYSTNEDILLSCLQQADDTVGIIAANLQANGNLHDVDIALPPSDYTDVNDYIVGQLISSGESLIYVDDEAEKRWVPTKINGLWLRFHPTVRPHIVGIHDIPASLRTVSK